MPREYPSSDAVHGVGDGDGDRQSVTGVNGTVARFEMTYSPNKSDRIKFGPPLMTRLPSAAYLVGATFLAGLVLYAYTAAPSSSWVFRWVVEGDRGRPLSAGLLASIVLISALATVLRTHMRGVIVGDEWLEARYLLPLGIPKARRWAWAQVNRVVVDRSRVALELWDGTFERLPEVRHGGALSAAILRQAHRHRILVTVLQPSRS